MSANTIARWNAIPMTPSLKRPRQEDDNSDADDDISLVSRSPSPVQDDMDVDMAYEEDAQPAVTVDTRINSSNKGFALLAKLGWSEGQPLGISGDGRVDPIPFHVKSDFTGVGKVDQDVRMIETTVSHRRGLDSERQVRETEEERQLREDEAARRSALQVELSDVLRAFYCALCDKQFKNVAQYDEHTNSYAHHHKARFKDMQASVNLKPPEEVERRKEKERKREEKELRKIAKANGIKMAKPITQSSSLASFTSDTGTVQETGRASAPVVSSVLQPTSSWASVTVPPTFRSSAVNQALSAPLPPSSPPPPPPPPVEVNSDPPPPIAPSAQPTKSGWQKFQMTNSRRK